MQGFKYMATIETPFAVTTTNDIFQLRNGANTLLVVKEIRLYQTSDTALANNAVVIRRGVGGTTGTGLSERKYDITSPTPGALALAANSAFGVNVGTLDWEMSVGWNILQDFLWLPTPEIQLPLAASDMMSLSIETADALTIGGSVVWEEYGV